MAFFCPVLPPPAPHSESFPAVGAVVLVVEADAAKGVCFAGGEQVSGPVFFGYGVSAVQQLLRGLPGADRVVPAAVRAVRPVRTATLPLSVRRVYRYRLHVSLAVLWWRQ